MEEWKIGDGGSNCISIVYFIIVLYLELDWIGLDQRCVYVRYSHILGTSMNLSLNILPGHFGANVTVLYFIYMHCILSVSMSWYFGVLILF